MAPTGDRTCKVCLIPPGFLADRRDSGTRQSYQDFILLPAVWRFGELAPGTTGPPCCNFAANPPCLPGHRMGVGMRVAVIGTGIPGNAAAWTLSKNYPVTVYDREIRPGGHSHTVTTDYDGTPLAVHIGFIVYNELNYPELTALFAHLAIETVESCMSFAVTADGGRFEWKGGGNS